MKITRQLLRVLTHFCANSTQHQYGLEIIKGSKVSPGALYPILIRLERNGWLESDWEAIDEVKEGRPARRYYTLTTLGLERGQIELADPQHLAPQSPWYKFW